MTERFQIIHLGNPYDFVVKDHQTNRTYGTLQGDDKSLMELLNELHEENKALRKQLNSEHQMLENAILLERTRMGQNSLKQYKEAIQ